jgi:hypothetical protein
MLHREALVRTNVLEEYIASIIRVTRIGKLGALLLADSFHPDDGGNAILRNVGSNKSHTASQPIRQHSLR